jgi:hypothetical protein
MVCNRGIKRALHVPVRPERLPDDSSSPKLCPHLDCLEPAYILGVVEHEADGGLALVDLEREARQHNPLQNDAIGVGRQRRTDSHQSESSRLLLLHQQHRARAPPGQTRGSWGQGCAIEAVEPLMEVKDVGKMLSQC